MGEMNENKGKINENKGKNKKRNRKEAWRGPPRFSTPREFPPVEDTNFFVVYCLEDRNPQARHKAPTMKHPDYETAIIEANRLARKKPGRRYIVLHTHGPIITAGGPPDERTS